MDLCLRKTRAGKSREYREVIVFENLRFHKGDVKQDNSQKKTLKRCAESCPLSHGARSQLLEIFCCGKMLRVFERSSKTCNNGTTFRATWLLLLLRVVPCNITLMFSAYTRTQSQRFQIALF